jgi:hypothetical protein
MATPNLFTLSGRHLHVTFASSGIDGRPHFSYHDGMRSEQFTGDEIEITEKTLLGTLVSVTIMKTVDAGFTTFTVLIPAVNLAPAGSSDAIHTEGITTIHRRSIAPALERGQLDSYTVTRLHGTAQVVDF